MNGRREQVAGRHSVERLTKRATLVAGFASEIGGPLAQILINVDNLASELPKLATAVLRCSSAVRQHLGEEAFASVVGGEGEAAFRPSALEDLSLCARDALAGTLRLRDLAHRFAALVPGEDNALEMVDLRRLLDGVIAFAQIELELGARLDTAFGEVPPIPANPARLSQVFLNLLSNAAEAIPTSPTRSGRIAIRTWAEAGYAHVEVEDNGGGIAAGDLPHVFEPFFTTKGEAWGLGLAICNRVVGELHGDIKVRSAVGEGSCFIVRLPLSSVAVMAPAPARGRVLVIDDEEGIRWALQSLLRRDHDVVLANSGLEARALLENDRNFDVVLCDLMMPDMPGSDLHRWLRGLDPGLARRFVFVTGGGFNPRTTGYTATLSNPTVEKPFDPPQLVNLVSRLVATARCAP